MQLMPSTAREYNVRNPYDPKANIDGRRQAPEGAARSRSGAVELALAAYNAGEGAVKKFNGIPPYRETANYVTRSCRSPASSRPLDFSSRRPVFPV